MEKEGLGNGTGKLDESAKVVASKNKLDPRCPWQQLEAVGQIIIFLPIIQAIQICINNQRKEATTTSEPQSKLCPGPT